MATRALLVFLLSNVHPNFGQFFRPPPRRNIILSYISKDSQLNVTCSANSRPLEIQIMTLTMQPVDARQGERPIQILAVADRTKDASGINCTCAGSPSTCGKAQYLGNKKDVFVDSIVCVRGGSLIYSLAQASCADSGLYSCNVTYISPWSGSDVRNSTSRLNVHYNVPTEVTMSVTPDPPVLNTTLTLTCTAIYGLGFGAVEPSWQWNYVTESGDVDNGLGDLSTHYAIPKEYVPNTCALRQVSKLTIPHMDNKTGQRIRCLFLVASLFSSAADRPPEINHRNNVYTFGSIETKTINDDREDEDTNGVQVLGSRESIAAAIGALAGCVLVVVAGTACNKSMLPMACRKKNKAPPSEADTIQDLNADIAQAENAETTEGSPDGRQKGSADSAASASYSLSVK